MEVSRELAEQELDRFIEANDLDFDVEGVGDEERDSVLSTRRKLTKAIQNGKLSVDEKGVITVHPTKSENQSPVVFSRTTGACILAADRRGAKENVAKLFLVMAELTGCESSRFSKMHIADSKLCQVVTGVFLA